MSWTAERNIPALVGKTVVVTGGNVGLGFESCRWLAKKGADVVLASRSEERGQTAAQRIRDESPDVRVEVLSLDLVNLSSVEAFADALLNSRTRLDILLNNAGVVNLIAKTQTPEGREAHMATNHDGHYALTARLMPLLRATPGARVVTVTSWGHKGGSIEFDDLDWSKRPYNRVKAYGDSKLANLLFTRQLQRFFDDHDIDAVSMAAHPGLTATPRQQSIGIGGRLSRWAASPLHVGVAPQLFAATSQDVDKGGFYGPRFGLRGCPRPQRPLPQANDNIAARLWEVTAERTGVSFAT